MRTGRRRRSRRAPRALERAGDLLEANRGRLIALLQVEGGKTLDDSLSELREAADYCRFYAAQARCALAPEVLPGPTGESNELHYRGRGVFVCISPVEFPARDLSRPGDRSARRRQRGRRQAGGADAADRGRRSAPPSSGRRAGKCAPPGAGRRQGRRRARRRQARGGRRLHRLDRGRLGDQSRAGRQGRPDRAADRGDRRHQCHDRRCHRAARTGGR